MHFNEEFREGVVGKKKTQTPRSHCAHNKKKRPKDTKKGWRSGSVPGRLGEREEKAAVCPLKKSATSEGRDGDLLNSLGQKEKKD